MTMGCEQYSTGHVHRVGDDRVAYEVFDLGLTKSELSEDLA